MQIASVGAICRYNDARSDERRTGDRSSVARAVAVRRRALHRRDCCALVAPRHLGKMMRQQIFGRKLGVDWSAAEQEPAQAVNVFAAQATQHSHLLYLGFVAPPVIIDDADMQRASSLKRLPARIVARVVLTPSDMRKLVKILSENIESHEKLRSETEDEQ